jgi:hypothetical protein
MCIFLPQALVTVGDFGYPVLAFWFYCCQNLIWLSNLSILSVPDEGYSRNTSFIINLISTFLFGMSMYVTECCLLFLIRLIDLIFVKE